MVLLAALAAATPSPAETAAEPPLEALEIVEEVNGFEDEEDAWEEEEELEEGQGEADGLLPPEDCVLQSASARVVAYDAQGKVRLEIRYSSLDPTDVTVGYRLTGSKGSLGFKKARRHFARKGVLRLTEHLSESEMERVQAARGFRVDISVAAAPRYCHRFHTRRLTVKRTLHNQVIWSQSKPRSGRR